jgi:hypothetical protein
LSKGLFHCFACHVTGNVLDFVHRIETRDGETVSLRQAGIRLASISGLHVDGAPQRQETRRTPTTKKAAVSPSGDHMRSPAGPERPHGASATDVRPTRNKPLGFQLNLDTEHPYLAEREVPGLLIMPFGLVLQPSILC